MSEVAQVKDDTVSPVLEKLYKDNVVTLPSTGKEIKIRKVTLRTMKPITDLVGKVLKSLNLDKGNLPTVDLEDPAMILKLISDHYDEVTALIPKLADIEHDALLDLDLDESALIAQGVISLNKDFFTKKVLPMLRQFGINLGD